MITTSAIRCADITSAVVSSDDHHLFHIQRVKRSQFGFGQRWTFQLSRRPIAATSIGSPTPIPHLGELRCDEKTDAHMSIRRTEDSEDLIIVTTKGQVQSVNLSTTIVRRDSAHTSRSSATNDESSASAEMIADISGHQ